MYFLNFLEIQAASVATSGIRDGKWRYRVVSNASFWRFLRNRPSHSS